jgi:hypothetical protein
MTSRVRRDPITDRTTSLTHDQYDALIRKWNSIGKNERFQRMMQCVVDGHDFKRYDDAHVCVRCTKYTLTDTIST